jgi:hypothetical protein
MDTKSEQPYFATTQQNQTFKLICAIEEQGTKVYA